MGHIITSDAVHILTVGKIKSRRNECYEMTGNPPFGSYRNRKIRLHEADVTVILQVDEYRVNSSDTVAPQSLSRATKWKSVCNFVSTSGLSDAFCNAGAVIALRCVTRCIVRTNDCMNTVLTTLTGKMELSVVVYRL